VNDRGETSIRGLYTAGDSSDNARASMMALSGGAVIGSRAGENAGRYASIADGTSVVGSR
jgi:thioredoxin reductase